MEHFKFIRGKAQSGAVLVEFAILIPFLFLLLSGVAEIGYLYFHLDILNKSVQDGARYFADPQRSRQNNRINPINTGSSSNGTNITNARNLIIYGNIAGTGSPLLPYAANYNPLPEFYCAEEGTSAECASTTKHVRVTASYNHDFILGNVLRLLCANCLPNPYPLKATSVIRAEGGS
jgi:Flp pilus assembly protein TadG